MASSPVSRGCASGAPAPCARPGVRAGPAAASPAGSHGPPAERSQNPRSVPGMFGAGPAARDLLERLVDATADAALRSLPDPPAQEEALVGHGEVLAEPALAGESDPRRAVRK